MEAMRDPQPLEVLGTAWWMTVSQRHRGDRGTLPGLQMQIVPVVSSDWFLTPTHRLVRPARGMTRASTAVTQIGSSEATITTKDHGGAVSDNSMIEIFSGS